MSAKHNLLASPRGVARYPYLNEPDHEYAIKYGNAPEFKVQLVPSIEDGEAFKKQLEKFHDSELKRFSKDEGKQLKKHDAIPYADVLDKDTQDPTGEIAFKFKLKAEGKNSKTGETWSNSIAWKSAQNQPIQKPIDKVGGGSVIRIAYEPYCWNIAGKVGMTLRLKVIQLLELKTFTPGGDMADKLFDVEEGYAGVDEAPSTADVFSGADF